MSGKGNEAYEKLDREIGAKYGHLYQRVDPTRPAPEFKAWEEPQVSASMAEVLAKHYPMYKWDRDFGGNIWVCSDLDHEFSSRHFDKAMAHVAEQLAANGYGKLEDAWDEGWAHYRKHFTPNDPEFGNNPYRAATERGQG